jgi:ketosteroid isomerase-like protein
MSTPSLGVESVVRKHLHTFLQGQGADAIVSDYHDGARLYTEDHVFVGKPEIHRFFSQFLNALPPGATDRFRLKSLQVDGSMAFITWCVDGDIALGTDTFVVQEGKIVSQTFAMHAASPQPACRGDRF